MPNIISTPQNITANWVQIGTTEVKTIGYSFITLFLDIDINDALNVQVRALGRLTSGGSNYFLPHSIVRDDKVQITYIPHEIDNDEDHKIIIPFQMFNTIPYVIFQVRALTAGASAGQIESADYELGYQQ